MTADSRRAARMPVSPELIEDWFCLPRGNHVTDVRLVDRGGAYVIEFKIEGPDMPEVKYGEVIPEITPQYRRKQHELVELHPRI